MDFQAFLRGGEGDAGGVLAGALALGLALEVVNRLGALRVGLLGCCVELIDGPVFKRFAIGQGCGAVGAERGEIDLERKDLGLR